MDNIRDIQSWQSINCHIASLRKQVNTIVQYDDLRLEEYRNAVLCLYYRQPLPIIYFSLKTRKDKPELIVNEYELLLNTNSIFEAYAVYSNDLFDMDDGTLNGFYSDLSLPQKRRIDEANIEAKIFTYIYDNVCTQVKKMIRKLK